MAAEGGGGERPKLLYVTDGLPNFATLTTMAREGAEADIAAPIERLPFADYRQRGADAAWRIAYEVNAAGAEPAPPATP